MKKGWHWPLLIFGFLGTTATFDMFFLSMAAGHPSLVVEDDYYERAKRWDASRQSELRIEVKVTLGEQPQQDRVAVIVRDKLGTGLEDATVQLKAFHAAHANTARTFTLENNARGRHEGTIPLARAGAWQLRAQVTRGDEIVTAERSVLVPSRQ